MLTTTHDEWISAHGTPGVVSVVIPTHNRAGLLVETLESFFAQKYRPIQMVVVNDGSTDATERILAEFAEKAPEGCEVVYESQQPAGAPAARNRGASRTTGEFIVFMDDDDLASRDFLQSRVDTLNGNPRSNLCYGPWTRFTPKGSLYQLVDERCMTPEARRPWWYAFLANWDLLLQGCVIRRELVSKVGPWRTDLLKSQDFDYKARLVAEESCKPVYSSTGRIFYRMHGDSISGKLSARKLESHMDVLDQIESMTIERSDYEESKSNLADFLWYHAFWLYGSGEGKSGYRELLRAKSHDRSVCWRKGRSAGILDSLGLDFTIGQGYYILSRLKKLLRTSGPSTKEVIDRLPT